jgi:hypothetical protein
VEGFDALPNAIRHLGPWMGSKEGEVSSLRLPYRLMFAEQRFVIIHQHVSKLELETTPVTHGRAGHKKMCWRCCVAG